MGSWVYAWLHPETQMMSRLPHSNFVPHLCFFYVDCQTVAERSHLAIDHYWKVFFLILFMYVCMYVCMYLFIYLFMAVLGLRFCARALSSCGKRGPLFIAVRGPLTIVASLVAEHRLQMRRLSNCGSRAQLLRGTWDPPRPGLEPVSPALAGGFSTTAPPGKSLYSCFSDRKFSE